MALTIKVLGMGQLTGTTFSDLLLVSPVPAGKAQIVKTMRFINTNTSANISLSVVLTRGANDRQVSPKNVNIAPGAYLNTAIAPDLRVLSNFNA